MTYLQQCADLLLKINERNKSREVRRLYDLLNINERTFKIIASEFLIELADVLGYEYLYEYSIEKYDLEVYITFDEINLEIAIFNTSDAEMYKVGKNKNLVSIYIQKHKGYLEWVDIKALEIVENFIDLLRK